RQLAEKFPDYIKGKSFFIRGTTPLKERYIGNAKMFDEIEKRDFYKMFDKNVHFRDITNPFYEDDKNWPLVSQMQYIDINTWL
ncbi:MAG TPA: asparagine synthetase B, partial [Bacillota bacterium]|nr:asparagine synthetase B [Bacillota bacterium]